MTTEELDPRSGLGPTIVLFNGCDHLGDRVTTAKHAQIAGDELGRECFPGLTNDNFPTLWSLWGESQVQSIAYPASVYFIWMHSESAGGRQRRSRA